MGLTVYSQTPVAVGCVHPKTRQTAWSAVEKSPRHDTHTLCRKHAWNARSKQRHVPNAKQVLLWKGWVLKQRLNDVQSGVGAAATRAHVESRLRTELFVDSCSVRHQANCCANTREIPATWISIRTQGTKTCSCDETAALARHKHTWISLRAQGDMFRQNDCCVLAPRGHLDLAPCAKSHVPAKRLLHSHAASTLGSLSVRKRTCSCDNTAAFASCEHTWISLRAQGYMFRRKDCCIPTPRAHLDFSPCARRPACDNTAAFAQAVSTWIPLRAQRAMFRRKDCCVLTPRAHLDLSPRASKNKTCSCDMTAAFARHKRTWISLRA